MSIYPIRYKGLHFSVSLLSSWRNVCRFQEDVEIQIKTSTTQITRNYVDEIPTGGVSKRRMLIKQHTDDLARQKRLWMKTMTVLRMRNSDIGVPRGMSLSTLCERTVKELPWSAMLITRFIRVTHSMYGYVLTRARQLADLIDEKHIDPKIVLPTYTQTRDSQTFIQNTLPTGSEHRNVSSLAQAQYVVASNRPLH